MGRTKVDKVNKKAVKESEEVFELIHHLMHLFRSEQYRVVRDGPYDLTHMEGKLLGFFSRNPGSTLRDLVKDSARDKGQLGRLIRNLREQGLLEGQGDEGDRRSVRLHLTPAGSTIHQTLRGQVAKLSELAVQDLSDAEQRQLVALLYRVRDNLESVSDPGSKEKSPSKLENRPKR